MTTNSDDITDDGAELAAAIQAAEIAYAADVPDYAERVAFLARVRFAELAARRPDWSAEQIGQQLKAEGLEVGRDAFERGQNPGAVFFALSEVMGYRATTLAAFGSNRVH